MAVEGPQGECTLNLNPLVGCYLAPVFRKHNESTDLGMSRVTGDDQSSQKKGPRRQTGGGCGEARHFNA